MRSSAYADLAAWSHSPPTVEVTVSTQMSVERANQIPSAAKVDLKLEVVVIPVSDVDRAKRYYGGLGWRLDADFTNGADWRVVQVTPPGSPCSIHFGNGVTTATPGSAKNLYLVVSDMDAARGELIGCGADVSEPFHSPPSGDRPCRAATPTVAPMEPTPRSAIPVGTPGCSRRSGRGFLGGE